MTMGAQSAVAYRPLITETIATLQDINSSPLPDGACAFVTGTRQLFRLRKLSTKTVVSGSIVAPNAGGGRWVVEGAVAGALPFFVAATAQNSVDNSSSGDWLGPATAFFAVQSVGNWTLTASGCVLTYTGPAARYFVDLRATITFPGGASEVRAGISLNDDLTATGNGLAQGAVYGNVPLEDSVQLPFAAQRIITIVPGEVVQPKFLCTGSVDLLLDTLTLSVTPIP